MCQTIGLPVLEKYSRKEVLKNIPGCLQIATRDWGKRQDR
jgi:hypothetical protein